uniref:Signal recognition particle receptor subunit beta n=1 Tax=Crassostrea virginica TaxID=6565 RepID=A0A8B8ESM2_CRAVI|nr:signal recognition particle receptor subunit beta-like [Crassostrea virginica]
MDLAAVMNSFLEGLQKGDGGAIGIAVAIVVVILSILLFLLRGKGNKRQGILLLGMCDTGKTLMFHKLVFKSDKPLHTVTSISPNNGDFTVPGKNKSLKIYDLPGHERLRLQVLEQFKGLARGIVYVIDSASVQKDIKEVAEFLYTILSDPVILANAPPILIACNKQDQHLVKGATFIEKQLQKEMNTLRVTRSAALQQLDGTTGNNNSYLGKRNKDFEFSDLKPMKVQFVECSALDTSDKDQPGLMEVEKWLMTVA